MDEEAFDLICYQDKFYPYAMGHERFIDTLSHEFPQEKESIRQYVGLLESVGRSISPEQLPYCVTVSAKAAQTLACATKKRSDSIDASTLFAESNNYSLSDEEIADRLQKRPEVLASVTSGLILFIRH